VEDGGSGIDVVRELAVVKLIVDADRCSGHGRCYSVAPDLLDADDEGFVTVRGAALDVAPTLTAAAQLAAESCPEEAISIMPAQGGDGWR
jgi:ferredoxin